MCPVTCVRGGFCLCGALLVLRGRHCASAFASCLACLHTHAIEQHRENCRSCKQVTKDPFLVRPSDCRQQRDCFGGGYKTISRHGHHSHEHCPLPSARPPQVEQLTCGEPKHGRYQHRAPRCYYKASPFRTSHCLCHVSEHFSPSVAGDLGLTH